MLNPFRNWIVGNPWDSVEGDVADIARHAFATCLKAIEATRNEHRTTSVLLYGEPGSGKTHLIRRVRAHLAAKRPATGQSIFVYIRLSTSPSMIWRHIRRRLADDLLRPMDSGCAQLHGLLMRRLAMPGSHGQLLDSWKQAVSEGTPLDTNGFAVALETILSKIDPPTVEGLEIFDCVDGEHELPWPLIQVLRHMTHRRHPALTAAWLRGDSLPEEHLTRLGIAAQEDYAGDPEDRARRMVLALARFAGPDSPIVLCLDQLEALETTPGDQSGFAALARAVSTLHDESSNLVLVSCVQTSYRDTLQRFQSDFARISEFEGHLPPLDREQAARLLQSRRAVIPDLGLANGASALWPLDETDLTGLFDQAGLASARRILSEASRKLDRIGSLPEPGPGSLESEWRRRLDEASRAIADAGVEEILDHGLKSLVSVKNGPWAVREGSGDIEFVLRGTSGEIAISQCNQENMRSLSARLKRLVSLQEARPSVRVVIIRDPRLPISQGATTALEHLDELDFAGARLIHPSLEALSALEALRRILADAKSGDLTANGTAIPTETVVEWLAQHLPAALEDLFEEITGNFPVSTPQKPPNGKSLWNWSPEPPAEWTP